MRRGADGNRVTTLVFGFSPVTQFGLVAGDLGGLPENDRETAKRCAALLSGRDQTRFTISGVATLLSSGGLILISVPVSKLDRTSGRPGLTVVLGGVIPRFSTAYAEPCLHLLTAIESTMARVCGEVPGDVIRTADALTRHLQQEHHDVLEPLSSNLRSVDALFSSLSRWSPPNLLSRVLGWARIIDRPLEAPYATPPWVLGWLLARAVGLTRKTQYGQYIPFGGTFPAGLDGVESGDYRFVRDGVVVCWPAVTPGNSWPV